MLPITPQYGILPALHSPVETPPAQQLPKKKSSLMEKLVCGAIAGVIGTTIIFPLDIVKTRLQNQKRSASGALQYRGGLDCLRQIIAKEGARGLYRGLAPNLIGICPEKAIKLAVNDYSREYWGHKTGKHADKISPLYGMISGATAGICQVIATNPMEMVKIQMQLAGMSSATATVSTAASGAAAATAATTPPARLTAIDIVRSLGLRGLYRHTGATLARDVPFSIVFFPTLAALKMLGPVDAQGDPTFANVFGSGVAAGIVAAAVVTPMDVVKTRLQVTPKPGDPVFRGMAHCWSEIIKNEGPRALFKGVIPRVMIVSPLFAITVLVYEVQQRYLASSSSSGGKTGKVAFQGDVPPPLFFKVEK
ncbi:hypothetical protein HK104_004793 [Borealophlyctis nickersoniae]|nr:hypothetical protein HK104_004793 [Borealophlyctis nickersoniae]